MHATAQAGVSGASVTSNSSSACDNPLPIALMYASLRVQHLKNAATRCSGAEGVEGFDFRARKETLRNVFTREICADVFDVNSELGVERDGESATSFE